MWKKLKQLVLETADEVQKDNVTTLAASLAYFATFSVVPGVILLISLGGVFLGEETTRQEVIGQLRMWVGPTGANFVESAITNRSETEGSSLASMLGIMLVVVGATRFFAELQFALNTVWGVEPKDRVPFFELVRKRALSFVLILVLVVFLIASIIASAVAAALAKYALQLVPGDLVTWEMINFGVSFVLGTGLFTLVLKYFPDAHIRWRDVMPGAALTTTALLIGKFGLGYYIGNTAFASTYGAAGSIVVFLIFVFLSANIILIGAEFTQVWARINGQKIEPESHAKRLRRGLGRKHRPVKSHEANEEPKEVEEEQEEEASEPAEAADEAHE